MYSKPNAVCRESLPSRERGLKYHSLSSRSGQEGSLPSRERGLKFICRCSFSRNFVVAPLAGAWIEIIHAADQIIDCSVAPLAGAWIEMSVTEAVARFQASLPSRERGLKYCSRHWRNVFECRSPRGSVD